MLDVFKTICLADVNKYGEYKRKDVIVVSLYTLFLEPYSDQNLANKNYVPK